MNEIKNLIAEKGQGLRKNDNKARTDLIPVKPLIEVSKVLTKGAEKYAVRNWEAGMDWSKVYASMTRHLYSFWEGEDFDAETGCFHMAHLATNALFLLEYYNTFPQGDDRPILHKQNVKVCLDIDGVLADFHTQFYNYVIKEGVNVEYNFYDHYNFPSQIIPVWEKVKNDRDFWINMNTIESYVPFEVIAYVTAREIPDEWTKTWLEKNNFPVAPIYSTHGKSKVEVLNSLKGKFDFFIDDHWSNYVEMNSNNICTFLYHREYNKSYNVGYRRIKTLDELFQRNTIKTIM